MKSYVGQDGQISLVEELSEVEELEIVVDMKVKRIKSKYEAYMRSSIEEEIVYTIENSQGNIQEHKELSSEMGMSAEIGEVIQRKYPHFLETVIHAVVERREYINEVIAGEDSIYNKYHELGASIERVNEKDYKILDKKGEVVYLVDIEQGSIKGVDGEEAGYVKHSNIIKYEYVAVNGVCYSKHNIIMMCEYGYEVVRALKENISILTIDHVDKNTKNNKIRNLRIVTRGDNTRTAQKKGYEPFEYQNIL